MTPAAGRLRYAAVLFDLDGTLIDSGTDLVNSVRHALAQVAPGRALPDAGEILALVGNPLELFVRHFGWPDDPESTGRFVDAYRAHYAQHFNDHTRTYPGVSETLATLRAAGARLGLVTTKHQQQADFTAERTGLASALDHVHGWREDRQHKPHPEPVLLTCRALGVEPAQSLMVGDTELDIEAGRAAGAATCGITWGFRPAWLLAASRPDFLIASITDLVPIVSA